MKQLWGSKIISKSFKSFIENKKEDDTLRTKQFQFWRSLYSWGHVDIWGMGKVF